MMALKKRQENCHFFLHLNIIFCHFFVTEANKTEAEESFMKFKYLSTIIIAGMIASVVACQPKNDDDDAVKVTNHVDKGNPKTEKEKTETKATLRSKFEDSKVVKEDLDLYENQKEVLQSNPNRCLKVDDLKSRYFMAERILVSVTKVANPKQFLSFSILNKPFFSVSDLSIIRHKEDGGIEKIKQVKFPVPLYLEADEK